MLLLKFVAGDEHRIWVVVWAFVIPPVKVVVWNAFVVACRCPDVKFFDLWWPWDVVEIIFKPSLIFNFSTGDHFGDFAMVSLTPYKGNPRLPIFV